MVTASFATATYNLPNAVPSTATQTVASTSVSATQLAAADLVDTASNWSFAGTPAYVAAVAVPGVAAGVASSAKAVEITGAQTKTISIQGTRTTVGGKPGILINGLTEGIEDGKTVIPYFRFPGQTSYTQGSARPVVEADEFTWQRKTGKKFYAYVTSDDGLVQSNRVIIAAK